MAAKRRVAPSLGTFPTTGPIWVGLLIGVIVIVGALTFFPALVAGTDRRAAPHERREGVLMTVESVADRLGAPRRSASVVDTGAAPAASSASSARRGAGTPGAPGGRGIFDPAAPARGPPARRSGSSTRASSIRNPVMFVVEVTAALVTLVLDRRRDRAATTATAGEVGRSPGFELQIAALALVHGLFATYAEALAEARGKAQAAIAPRDTRSETVAHRRRADGTTEDVGSSALRAGDVIVIREGETIPGDGDVIEGVAYVNEAVITGESAPVLKEPGTDIRSTVTGGTLARQRHAGRAHHGEPGRDVPRPDDRARRGRQAPAHAQRDRAVRSCSPASRSSSCWPRRPSGRSASTRTRQLGIVVLVALLVCLIPTTIGGLLSAIGIAGMDRVARFNVLAMSGRAVEASGDVDVILLDKTGTITFGNRLASRIVAAAGRRRAGGRGGRTRRRRSTTRRPRADRSSSSPDARLARPAGAGDAADDSRRPTVAEVVPVLRPVAHERRGPRGRDRAS